MPKATRSGTFGSETIGRISFMGEFMLERISACFLWLLPMAMFASVASLTCHASEQSDASAVVLSEFINEHPAYPNSHPSTIAETASGDLVAAWFGGTREGNSDVGIWFARRVNGHWERAVEVATGLRPDGTRYPAWNPALFQAPNGLLFLFYKVGPSASEWWGMVMTSTDGGRTWSEPRRLPDGILGPIKDKPVTLPDGTWVSGSSTLPSWLDRPF